MDPIHPIVTPPAPMPPISPAARAEAIRRDRGRQGQGQGSTRQRTPQDSGRPGYEDYDEPAEEGRDGDDHPHIDITA
jgi:hypothetical protein